MTSTPLTTAGPVITWLCHFLSNTGLNDHAVSGVATALMLSVAVLGSWAVCVLLTRVVSPVVTRIVIRTSIKWDDVLLSPSMLKAWSYLITSIVVRITAPMALELYPTLMDIVRLAADILIVCAGVNVVNCFLMAAYTLIIETTSMRIGSLKGIRQMLQIIAFAIAAIIVVSLLIDRSPLIILSGLGASAAVLMLVFKDSILGLVAGVQLTLNDMLRPGDWITAPNHGANGTVIEVTLTTVKVRNFDQTIITIPPYALVSESFQNWRGMKESGGRRIMRSILIDLNSVRFMTSDELRSISSQPWVDPELTERIRPALNAADTASVDNNPVDLPQDGTDVAAGIPNVTVFRHYLERYITSLVSTIRDVPSLNCMVRELQPTPQGLPIEIYFFTTRQEWVSYEHLQADVIDHILAVVGRFGLRAYQSPPGATFALSAHPDAKLYFPPAFSISMHFVDLAPVLEDKKKMVTFATVKTNPMPGWRNWQTRRSQTPMEKSLPVRSRFRALKTNRPTLIERRPVLCLGCGDYSSSVGTPSMRRPQLRM